MKGKILDFKNFRNGAESSQSQIIDTEKAKDDFSDLLKKANNLRKWKKLYYSGIDQDVIMQVDFSEMKKVLNSNMCDILFEEKMIDSDFFLCAQYITDMVARTMKEPPYSWYVIDYLFEANKKESDCEKWRQAADLCFLLCSIFYERTNFRAMKYEDYANMGASFYNMFFYSSKREIGYHMSRNYKSMVSVTQRALF